MKETSWRPNLFVIHWSAVITSWYEHCESGNGVCVSFAEALAELSNNIKVMTLRRLALFATACGKESTGFFAAVNIKTTFNLAWT